jgi:hypothetical protein
MVGAQYKISENALRHVIDASKEYVRWMGLVPVSPEVKEKIEGSEKIFDAAKQQADNLERRMKKIFDRANKRYSQQVAKILKQSTGIPALIFEEFIYWPELHMNFISQSDNDAFEKALQNADEILLEPSIFAKGYMSDLVHCPRLEAMRLTQAKGKWYNVKIIDASKNDQGFAVTLYTPAPKFSRNYQMLKQFAALEQLLMQSLK